MSHNSQINHEMILLLKPLAQVICISILYLVGAMVPRKKIESRDIRTTAHDTILDRFRENSKKTQAGKSSSSKSLDATPNDQRMWSRDNLTNSLDKEERSRYEKSTEQRVRSSNNTDQSIHAQRKLTEDAWSLLLKGLIVNIVIILVLLVVRVVVLTCLCDKKGKADEADEIPDDYFWHYWGIR